MRVWREWEVRGKEREKGREGEGETKVKKHRAEREKGMERGGMR